MGRHHRRPSSGVTHIYYMHADDQTLLYVGITDCWERRQAQHRREKWWWNEIAYVLVMPYPTRAEALHAETLAILGHNVRGEIPRYNIQGVR